MSHIEWRDWSTGARIAAACLAGALLLDAAAVVRLRRVHDAGIAPPLQMERAPRIGARIRDDGEIVRQAALRAPFDVGPTPAQLALSTTVLQQVAPPLARPRLVGTVVEGQNKGFVVVEMPDARMQLVRIGERAGELKLRSVAAGEAVFDDAHGDRVSLKTSRAGSGVEVRP